MEDGKLSLAGSHYKHQYLARPLAESNPIVQARLQMGLTGSSAAWNAGIGLYWDKGRRYAFMTAGGYHDGSDIDLCLVTDITVTHPEDKKAGKLFKEVLQTSLDNSECPVELDLAAIFDMKKCGLTCFNIDNIRQLECLEASTGCMGVFKTQKGFNGFVPPITNVRDMYPLTTIWERSSST